MVWIILNVFGHSNSCSFVVDVVLWKIKSSLYFAVFFFFSERDLIKFGTRISKATKSSGCRAISEIKSSCSASSENLISWRHLDWANSWNHSNGFKFQFRCTNSVHSYLVCLPCSTWCIWKARNDSFFHLKKKRKSAVSCKISLLKFCLFACFKTKHFIM